MRGLLLRLSELDPGAESAVRVIGYFDSLVSNHAGFDALVRSAARIAECPAGLSDARGRVIARYDQDGKALLREVGAVSAEAPYLSDPAAPARVWLEREGGSTELDEIVVERMAAAARITSDRADPWRTLRSDDPVVLAMLLSERSSDAERSRSAQLLGIPPATAVRVAVAAGRYPEGDSRTAELEPIDDPEQVIRQGLVDGQLVALLPGSISDAVAPDPGHAQRLGVGGPHPLYAAQTSLLEALAALKFTAGPAAPRRVDYPSLGSLALLARMPAAELRSDPTVQHIARLAALPGGGDLIETIERVTAAGSLREAAKELHLHHTSVAHRVERIERELGLSLGSGDGKTLARVALVMWRLSLDPDGEN